MSIDQSIHPLIVDKSIDVSSTDQSFRPAVVSLQPSWFHDFDLPEVEW